MATPSTSSEIEYTTDSSYSNSVQSSSHDELHPSKKQRLSMEKRQFKDDWKTKYLMWPIHNNDSNMICIHCQEHLRTKSSTASRHIERKHPSSLSYTTEKRMRLIRQFESMYAKQRSTLTAAIEPDALVKLAPYKLAFVIGKHKMPFSSFNAFLEFAKCADPNSSIFTRMAGSRDTVTRQSQEIHQVLLRPNVAKAV